MDRIVGNPKIDASLDRLHSTEGTDNPHTNPHISAHNAIQVDGSRDRKLDRNVKAAALEAHYQKACRRAKKKGRQPPSRDDYVKTTYAYGHPVTVPYYAPYTGNPCLSSGYVFSDLYLINLFGLRQVVVCMSRNHLLPPRTLFPTEGVKPSFDRFNYT